MDAQDKSSSDGRTKELANTAVRLKLKNIESSENYVDMFGNGRLHHMFAYIRPDYQTIKLILQFHPDSPQMRNQFGRIPLHYCVDRCAVDLPSFRILLKAYPSGASVEDDNGMTPYDLACKWRQPNRILKALLAADPSQDWPELIKLRWGPLAPFVSFILDPTSSRQSRSNPGNARVAVNDNNDDDRRRDQDNGDDLSVSNYNSQEQEFLPTAAGAGAGTAAAGGGPRFRHPDDLIGEIDEDRANGLLVTLATVVSRSDPRLAVDDHDTGTLYPDPGIMEDRYHENDSDNSHPYLHD